MADDGHSRFVMLSEKDIESLLDNKLSNNTKRNTDSSDRVLSEYTVKRNICLDDLYQLSKSEMNDFLQKLYAAVRKLDGTFIAKMGLCHSVMDYRSIFVKCAIMTL